MIETRELEAPATDLRPLQQAVVGTLAYMSPEQAEGKPVDARSDLFSFGCVLYEMVSGRRAFVGDSAVSVLAAVVRGEPEPLGRIAQPQVQALINRCLAKNPESRYRSASALLKDVAGLNQRRASKLPSLRKAALAGGRRGG